MLAAGPCLVTVGRPAHIAGWRGCVSVDGRLRVRRGSWRCWGRRPPSASPVWLSPLAWSVFASFLSLLTDVALVGGAGHGGADGRACVLPQTLL